MSETAEQEVGGLGEAPLEVLEIIWGFLGRRCRTTLYVSVPLVNRWWRRAYAATQLLPVHARHDDQHPPLASFVRRPTPTAHPIVLDMVDDRPPAAHLTHTSSGYWRVIWAGGQTAAIELDRGKWNLDGQSYQLQPTTPISFTWGPSRPQARAVVQTLGGVEEGGRILVWRTTDPHYNEIRWRYIPAPRPHPGTALYRQQRGGIEKGLLVEGVSPAGPHTPPAARPAVAPTPSVCDRGTFLRRFRKLTGGAFDGMDFDNVLIGGGAVLASLLDESWSEAGGGTTTLRPAWADTDVDLFMYGLAPAEARAKLQAIWETLKEANARARRTAATCPHFSKPQAKMLRRYCRPDDLPESPTGRQDTSSGSDELGWDPHQLPDTIATDPLAVPIVSTAYTTTFLLRAPMRSVQVVMWLYPNAPSIPGTFDVDCCGVVFDGLQVLCTPRCRDALNARINTADFEHTRSMSTANRLIKYAARGFPVAVPKLDRAAVNLDLQHADGVPLVPEGIFVGVHDHKCVRKLLLAELVRWFGFEGQGMHGQGMRGLQPTPCPRETLEKHSETYATYVGLSARFVGRPLGPETMLRVMTTIAGWTHEVAEYCPQELIPSGVMALRDQEANADELDVSDYRGTDVAELPHSQGVALDLDSSELEFIPEMIPRGPDPVCLAPGAGSLQGRRPLREEELRYRETPPGLTPEGLHFEGVYEYRGS